MKKNSLAYNNSYIGMKINHSKTQAEAALGEGGGGSIMPLHVSFLFLFFEVYKA